MSLVLDRRTAVRRIAPFAGVSILALLAASPSLAGAALPSGGQVVAGQAAISTAPGQTAITQAGGHAIINWQDFSIAAGNKVLFNNGSGATLNRVTGGNLSQIDGVLKATGSVYLINPQGVVIGAGGKVITGGSFVASTRDVDNDAFLRGDNLHASGTSNGNVVNQGRIVSRYGDTILIGKSVSNSGTIRTPNGTAGLAAGDDVVLRPMGGDARISISAGKGDVTNTGTIAAAQAELNAAGGNVYAVAGNQGGITATGTAQVGGRIWLTGGGTTEVSGAVTAKNADGSGGTIIATAPTVQVDADANISASGTTGGTVLVGGDEAGGSDPARKRVSAPVANAQTTMVAQGAKISADGSTGAGGAVVVWSDDYTSYHGAISAVGAGSGNGGSAEVSSHGVLDFVGSADLTAQNGAIGTLLLDPFAVTIVSGTGGTISSNKFTPTANSSLGATTLLNALASANVTVTTGSTGSGTGSITLNSGVNLTWTSTSTLTLDASAKSTGSIALNGAITATNGGLNIKAGSGGAVTDTAAIAVKTFVLTSGIWAQNAASLPSFSAANFTITGGSFLRVTGGDGSSTPYQVADIYGLQGMIAFQGSSISLAGDIDASSTATWNGGAGFVPLTLNSGLTFDGQGHTISGLTLSGNNVYAVGLFGANYGTIQNVTVNGTITAGGVYVGGIAGLNQGTVSNAHSGVVIVGADGSDGQNYLQWAGSLVGMNNSTGVITGSSASGSVSGYNNLGGLAGYNYGQITNSSASGRVTPSSLLNVPAYAGGLVGVNDGGIIDGGSASGDVIGQLSPGFAMVGGLVGENLGTIRNSHASGNVTGNTSAGGLVGINGGYSNGTPVTGTIDNSYYEVGTVTGYADTAGLVGTNGDYSGVFGGTITNSYVASTATVVGTRDSGGLVGSNYNTGSITGSHSGATVAPNVGNSGDQIYETGGLVGRSSGTLTDSYSTGTVNAGTGTYYTGGLAGSIGGGTVNNVYATGNVTADYYVGGLVGDVSGAITNAYATGTVTVYSGTAGGFAGIVDGTVSNAYATGDVKAANGTSAGGLGGFTGMNNGTVSSSWASGNVTGADGSNGVWGSVIGGFAATNNGTLSLVDATGVVGGWTNIGGLVGENSSGATITGSYATGAVSAGVWEYEPINVGGLVGENDGSIDTSYAAGNVTAATPTDPWAYDFYAGGLVGTNKGSISRAYATGVVTATGTVGVGGLVGLSQNGSIADSYATSAVSGGSFVGGLIGDLEYGTVQNTYATGSVAGSGVGALIGSNGVYYSPGTITSSYYNSDLNLPGIGGGNGSTGVVGLTAAQMQVSSNFAGFDFVNTWSPADATYRPELYGVSYVVKVVVDGGSVQYGDPISTAFNYHSLQNGDLASGITGLVINGVAQGAGVGSYAVTASGASLTSSSGQAYRFIYQNGTLNITPRIITVQADAASKTYGGTDPSLAYEITGGTFLSGDSISGALSRAAGENVGAYAISLGSLAINNSNYSINYQGANLTITPATLTYAANAATRTYGGTDPGFSGSVTGFVNGDTLNSAVTGTLAFSTTASQSSNAGSYAINGSGLSAANYVFAQASGNAGAYTITPATLTFTASAASRAYNAANGTLAGTVTGYVLNQTQSNVFNSVSWSSTAGTTTDVGNYLITGTGSFKSGMSGNYTIVQAASNSSALTIVPKTLTWTVSANGTATYGTLGTLGTITLTGVASADTTKVKGVTGLFDAQGTLVSYLVSTDAGTYTQKAASLAAGTGGDKSMDYVLGTGTTKTFTISPKALTYSTGNASGTYGTVSALGTVSLNGVISADNGLVTGTEGLFTGATPVSYVFNTAANSYTEKVTALAGTRSANYTIAASGNTTGTYTINKATLTYSTADAASTYGTVGALGAVTLYGLVANDGSSISGTEALYSGANPVSYVFNTSAGGYQEKVTGISGTGAANYVLATTGNTIGTFTINPMALTVTPDSNQSKIYNTTDPVLTYHIAAGNLVGGDTLSGLLARSAGENVGSYLIGQGNLAASGNYTLGFTPGVTFAISPASLTITAGSLTKTYGDALTFAGTEFTTSAMRSGDSVLSVDLSSAGAAATAQVSGSPYAITALNAVGNGLTNYTISYAPGSLTINPMALTVTAGSLTKTYGDTLIFAGTEFSAGTMRNGDTITGVDLSSAGAAATAQVSGSPYAVTALNAVGTGLSNYAITYAPGSLTINPATLTITAGNLTKTYGDTLIFAGTEFSPSGLVNGDSVTSVSLSSSGAAAAAHVAGSPYAITASNAAGTGLGNYTIGYVDGSLTVSPMALTVIATAGQSKTYGDANPSVYAYQITGGSLANGDTLSGALARAAGENTGSYAIGQGTLAATADYTLSYAGGSFAITPKALSVTAGSTSKVYGDTADLTAAGFTASGLVNGDKVTSIVFASSGAGATATVGSYVITASSAAGTGLGNYTITYNPGALAVTQRALTVTAANASAVYGAALPSFTVTATGLVNGDTLSGAAVSANSGHAGSYAITQGTLAASQNYLLTFRAGTLTITPASLVIAANDISAPSVASALPTARYAGLVNGDISAVARGLQFGLFPVSGVSYTVVPFGASASDYSIAYVSGLLTITASQPSQISLAIPPQTGTASGSLTIGGQTFTFANAATSAIGGGADGGSGVLLFPVGVPGQLSGFASLVLSDYSNATGEGDRLSTQ